MVALEYLMRRLISLPVILSLAFAAQANDTGEISLRSKALASASAAALSAAPAFSAPAPASRHSEGLPASGRDPLPQLLLADELDERVPTRSACQTTARDFCYDLAQRRIVYRAAREYMPSVAGLSPEGISVRRNRLIVTYSFK
jgi:hypothetical protein